MKVYFPGLNGLRFIAASLVIVSHVQEMKFAFGIPNSTWLSLTYMTLLGDLAVTFFFVLSGFLITYLLLLEKQENGTVSIRQFYLRRVLRIFPLYYLIILLGFVILPQIDALYFPGLSEKMLQHRWLKFLFFLFLVPNVALVLIHPIPYISHTWSIGVEEQFYLVWPHIIKRFRNPVKVMVAIIVLYMFFQKGLQLIIYLADLKQSFIIKINEILHITRIHCMSIGGICAYVYFKKKEAFLRVIYRKQFQLALYITTAFTYMASSFLVYLVHEIFACLFGLIILNIATNKNSMLKFETVIFNYLGKISYGLYMYHYFCIRLTFNYVSHAGSLFQRDAFLNSLLLVFISIALTILISAISYHFFEHLFLKIKARHSPIITNERPRE